MYFRLNMKVAHYLTLGLVLLSGSLLGQLKGNFRSITVDEGLAQNTVWDVLKDHKGYLWIGTADGLNRYDGQEFVHYKHRDDDSTSLGGSTYFVFHQDTQHNLWVFHDKGIDRYNYSIDRFERVYAPNEPCTYIQTDTTNRIWFLSGYHQVMALNPVEGRMVDSLRLDFPNTQVALTSRYSLKVNDTLFVTQLNPNYFLQINPYSKNHRITKNPEIIAGAFGSYSDKEVFYLYNNQIIFFNILTQEFRYQPMENGIETQRNFVFTDFRNWNNRFYGSCAFGLFEIDLAQRKFLSRTTQFGDPSKSSVFYIQCLYVDDQNNFYIGTNGNGLKIYSPYQNRFPHFTTGNSFTDFTKSICKIGDKVAVGNYGSGLVIYHSEGNFTHIPLGKPNTINSVLAMERWDDRHLLFIHDKYLILFDVALMQEKKRIEIDEIGIGSPSIKQHKEYWYVSTDKKIIQFDKHLNWLKEQDLSESSLTHLYVEDSFILLGTVNGVRKLLPDFSEVAMPSFPYFVKHISRASSGSYYISTTQGLFETDSQLSIIKEHRIRTGLPDDFIYAALEDNSGHIWMSHNKGITRLEPSTGHYTHYGVKDGLQSNEFNTGAYYKDSAGLLYFGGVNGINIIDPNHLLQNPDVPQIAINEINLGDMPFPSDTSYNEIKQIKLPYDQNTLSFNFSALDMSQPEQNLYAYFLQGYDEKWIESGTKHFARYANLPPGRYVFKIKVANGDGVWSTIPRELPITIIPPIWQRAWFIVVASLLGLVITGILIRYLIQRQSAKLRQELEIQHKLELERIRISRDLHDNVGAQLSYLITNMEWMAEHPETLDLENERNRLKSLSEAGRQAILTLRQTIWAISQNALTVEEFADRYKQYALKMTEFNSLVRVTFEESIRDDSQLRPDVALNLFRICQEALNNALKHAEAQHISVHFYSDNTCLFRFTLSDDGKGFDYENGCSGDHHGLKNMKARAQECGANIQIETAPGRGTTVILAL